jgi:ribulose 1,5-bisphosphate carboxylase large subunit-like protein
MHSNDSEHIRKTVGRTKEREKRLLERMWKLRQRLLELGVDLTKDDERIRKVVGRSGDGAR